MKLVKYVFVIISALVFIFTVSGSLDARMKWKGYWYLRGRDVCKEINMDRKGRTTIGIYPKAIVEKIDGDYFLTVESMGKKYSYQMNERSAYDYDLDLISVGPNLPLPKESSASVEGAYSAIFRKMVDCQATIAAEVKESPAK